jgi:exosortase/archaeosortase family protein
MAFGGFYACLMYTSALRRILFMAASTIVPVIANGLRALGIVLLGHYLGSAEAAATDHILYGWLFFSLVTFLLILIGLPFRQPLPQFIERKNYVSGRRMIRGTGVVLVSLCVIAAVPRLLVDKFDNQFSVDSSAGELRILAPSGCQEASAPRPLLINPATPGVGNLSSEGYRCGTDLFMVTVRSYPMRIGARPVFTDLRADVTEPGWSALVRTNIEGGAGPLAYRWAETQYVDGPRFAAIASRLWVDGRPEGGMRARLKLALNSLRGSQVPPIVAIVSYAGLREPASAQRAFSSFLSEIKFSWAGTGI